MSKALGLIVAASCVSVAAAFGEDFGRDWDANPEETQQVNSKFIEDEEDFYKTVKRHSAVIMFVSTGGSHDKLIPMWEKMAKTYHDKGVQICVINCEHHMPIMKICKKEDIQDDGHAHIRYYRPEVYKELKKGDHYLQEKTFDALSKFMEKRLEQKCQVHSHADCDAKEIAYINEQHDNKIKDLEAEMDRLRGIQSSEAGQKMSVENRLWIKVRLWILTNVRKTKHEDFEPLEETDDPDQAEELPDQAEEL